MEKILALHYGLDADEIVPYKRQDTGHDNQLFKVHAKGSVYFLKEIPSHSMREGLDLLYSELRTCVLEKSKIVLPVKSLNNKYVISVGEKQMMLYPFVEHQVLNDVAVDTKTLFLVLDDLFSHLSLLNVSQHPFKTYPEWFRRASAGLRKKIAEHEFIELLDEYAKTRFGKLEFLSGVCHFDLNPFNVWIDERKDIYISDFDNVQIAPYAKDIFDLCSNYLKQSDNNLHISNSDFNDILSFSKKYIPNVEAMDIKFLLLRPKLGELFDPRHDYSSQELRTLLDCYFRFCSI